MSDNNILRPDFLRRPSEPRCVSGELIHFSYLAPKDLPAACASTPFNDPFIIQYEITRSSEIIRHAFRELVKLAGSAQAAKLMNTVVIEELSS